MKLSEAIERFIDLKIEGEPKTSDWCSLDESHRRRLEYYAELEQLRHQIDKVLETHHG